MSIYNYNFQKSIIKIKDAYKLSRVHTRDILAKVSGYSRQGLLLILKQKPFIQIKLDKILRDLNNEFNEKFIDSRNEIIQKTYSKLEELCKEHDLINHNKRGRKKKIN